MIQVNLVVYFARHYLVTEYILTFYSVRNFIVRLGELVGWHIFDGFQLSGDCGGVKIRGEDDSLQLSEMTLLHQPGCCLDASQGPGSEVGGFCHLSGDLSFEEYQKISLRRFEPAIVSKPSHSWNGSLGIIREEKELLTAPISDPLFM